MKEEEEFDLDKETDGMMEDNELVNSLKLKLSQACGGKYLTLNKLAKKISTSKDTLYGILVMLMKENPTTVLIQSESANAHDNRYKIALNEDEFVEGLKKEVDFLKGQIKIREQKIEYLTTTEPS